MVCPSIMPAFRQSCSSSNQNNCQQTAKDLFNIFRTVSTNKKAQEDFSFNCNEWATFSNVSLKDLEETRKKWFLFFQNSRTSDFFISAFLVLNALTGLWNDNYTLSFIAVSSYVFPHVLLIVLTMWIHLSTQIAKPLKPLYGTIFTVTECLKVLECRCQKFCGHSLTRKKCLSLLHGNSFNWKRVIKLRKISTNGVFLGISIFVLLKDVDFDGGYGFLAFLSLSSALVSTATMCIWAFMLIVKASSIQKEILLKTRNFLLWFQRSSEFNKLCPQFCFLKFKFPNLINFQESKCLFQDGECSFLTVWFVMFIRQKAKAFNGRSSLKDILPSYVCSREECGQNCGSIYFVDTLWNLIDSVYISEVEMKDDSQTNLGLYNLCGSFGNSASSNETGTTQVCVPLCTTPAETHTKVVSPEEESIALNIMSLNQGNSSQNAGNIKSSPSGNQLVCSKLETFDKYSGSSYSTESGIYVNSLEFLRNQRDCVQLDEEQTNDVTRFNNSPSPNAESKLVSVDSKIVKDMCPSAQLGNVECYKLKIHDGHRYDMPIHSVASTDVKNRKIESSNVDLIIVKKGASNDTQKSLTASSKEVCKTSRHTRSRRKSISKSQKSKSSLEEIPNTNQTVFSVFNSGAQTQMVDTVSSNSRHNIVKSKRNHEITQGTKSKHVAASGQDQEEKGATKILYSFQRKVSHSNNQLPKLLDGHNKNWDCGALMDAKSFESSPDTDSNASNGMTENCYFGDDKGKPHKNTEFYVASDPSFHKKLGNPTVIRKVRALANAEDCDNRKWLNSRAHEQQIEPQQVYSDHPGDLNNKQFSENVRSSLLHPQRKRARVYRGKHQNSPSKSFENGSYVRTQPLESNKSNKVNSSNLSMTNPRVHSETDKESQEDDMFFDSFHDMKKASDSDDTEFPMQSSDDQNYRFHPETGCSSDTSYSEIHQGPQRPIIMWKSDMENRSCTQTSENMNEMHQANDTPSDHRVSHGNFNYNNCDFEFSYRTNTENLTFKFYCESEGEFDESTPRLERKGTPVFVAEHLSPPVSQHLEMDSHDQGKNNNFTFDVRNYSNKASSSPNEQGTRQDGVPSDSYDRAVHNSMADDLFTDEVSKADENVDRKPKCNSEKYDELHHESSWTPEGVPEARENYLDSEKQCQLDKCKMVNFKMDNIGFQFSRLQNSGALKLLYHKRLEQRDFLFKSRFKRIRFRSGNVRPRYSPSCEAAEEAQYSNQMGEQQDTEDSVFC